MELTKRSHSTILSKMNRLVAEGKAEMRLYKVKTRGGKIYPTPHYRLLA